MARIDETTRRSSTTRRWPGLIVVLLLVSTGFNVEAIPYRSFVRGSAITKKGKDGFPANEMPIVFVDSELPALLLRWPGKTVDVVMQQCYGAAYGPYIKLNPPPNWTFCSASGGTDEQGFEESKALEGFIPGSTNLYLDCFTRAWNEDALLYPGSDANNGMKQHFTTAKAGRPASPSISQIVPSPFDGPRRNLRGIDLKNNNFPNYVVHGTLGNTLGDYVLVGNPKGTPTEVWLQVKLNDAGTFWQVVGTVPDFLNPVPPAGYPFTSIPAGDVEHPKYLSSSNAVDDQRSLALPVSNTNPVVTQYAILAQWDKPSLKVAGDPRYAANIANVYNMLVSTYHVPTNNIVVMYYQGQFRGGNVIPQFNVAPGPNGAVSQTLPEVPIDSPTGFDDSGLKYWFSDYAINGMLFKDGAGKTGANGGTNVPNQDSRLFFYNTGHGAQSRYSNAALVRNGYAVDSKYKLTLLLGGENSLTPGFDPASEYLVALESAVIPANFSGFIQDTSALLEFTNNALNNFSDPQDLIQISTLKKIPLGAHLAVNGYSDPSWSSLQPILDTNTLIYDLDPLVPGLLTNTYTYQVSIPNMLLYPQSQSTATNGQYGTATNGGSFEVTLDGLGAANFDPGFIQAVIVRGVDQEFDYLPPDVTAVTNVAAVDFGGGMLLTWPSGLINYRIQTNADLTTTNWITVSNTALMQTERTGSVDPGLPMGANWAFFGYSSSQMFFRLLGP